MELVIAMEQIGKLCKLICYGDVLLQQCEREKPTGPVSGTTSQETDQAYEIVKRLLPETPSSDSFEYTPLSLLRSCVETAENLLQQLDVSAKEPVTDGVIHDANGTREEINTEYEEANRLAKRLEWLPWSARRLPFGSEARQDIDGTLSNIASPGRAVPDDMAALCSCAESLRLLTKTSNAKSAINAEGQLASRFNEAIARMQQVAILDLLKFQSIHERFDSITQAQERTFSWLLGSKDSSTDGARDTTSPEQEAIFDKARQRWIKWLQEGDGFFYISGKPGAGKSTLVKFICLHDNFYRYTQEWAEGHTLLVGRFFFWKPGKSEQKSISGLLRGLLYSVLERTPSITSIAFPELCDDLLHQRVKSPVIEHRDVERAFDNILKNMASGKRGYKMVLKIDGLDEFEGDHAELLKLMKSWVTKYHSSVKICVSSREYGISEDFFAHSPKFRLHELTRGDMFQLITSRLKPNKFFASLPAKEDEEVKNLMCDRAEGVFLWVVMVVAAMDDGLLSGAITNAGELKRSVQDCPTELDDMLPHLLTTVSIHYRPWASKAISLVKYAQFKLPELLISGDCPPGVGLMDLMLLDGASPNWNLAAFQPRSESKMADIPTRLEAARKKILGRCKGFLNVITISQARSWPANGDERMYAAVTHRSVVEFLDSDLAEGFMSHYLINFHPFYASSSTMLACLRFLEPSYYPLLKPPTSLQGREGLILSDVLADSLQERWQEMLKCAYLTGQAGSPRFTNLLDSVGDAIKRHLTIQLTIQRIRLAPEASSAYQLLSIIALGNRVYEYSEWRRSKAIMDTAKYPMSIVFLQAFHDILQYLRLDDYEFPAADQHKDEATLINKPVDWIRWNLPVSKSNMPCERFSNLFTEFFERGIDVNWTPPADEHRFWKGSKTIDGTPLNCWQLLLWSMLVGEIPFTDKYGEYVARFLDHGADLDVEIFTFAPLSDLHMERLTPQDEWVLLVPFVSDKTIIDIFVANSLNYDDEARRRFDTVPAVLIRDSTPLYKTAEEKGWHFTARNLVALWFSNDAHYSAQPLREKRASSLDVQAWSGILGSQHGVCDLGIYLEELRITACLLDASATIRRQVKFV